MATGKVGGVRAVAFTLARSHGNREGVQSQGSGVHAGQEPWQQGRWGEPPVTPFIYLFMFFAKVFLNIMVGVTCQHDKITNWDKGYF